MCVPVAGAPRRPMPACGAGRLVLIAVLLLGRAAPPLGAAQGPAADPAGIVFAADGAGNFQCASAMLRTIVAEDGLPLEVRTFVWSHGYLRMLSDQMGFRHMQEQGRALAAAVRAYHAEHPGTTIFLFGHSAGCTVIATALEALPPGLVERAVLLSPSLSAHYNLRPALANVRQGMHVFYSRRDWYYLGVYTTLVGTADRTHGDCGGRVGFDLESGAIDADVRAKLHQRPWQPADRALGNNGGHYGHYQPAFLRAWVLPLLVP